MGSALPEYFNGHLDLNLVLFDTEQSPQKQPIVLSKRDNKSMEPNIIQSVNKEKTYEEDVDMDDMDENDDDDISISSVSDDDGGEVDDEAIISDDDDDDDDGTAVGGVPFRPDTNGQTAGSKKKAIAFVGPTESICGVYVESPACATCGALHAWSKLLDFYKGEMVFPGPGDNAYSFVCGKCNVNSKKGKPAVIHDADTKTHLHLASTALFNLIIRSTTGERAFTYKNITDFIQNQNLNKTGKPSIYRALSNQIFFIEKKADPPYKYSFDPDYWNYVHPPNLTHTYTPSHDDTPINTTTTHHMHNSTTEHTYITTPLTAKTPSHTHQSPRKIKQESSRDGKLREKSVYKPRGAAAMSAQISEPEKQKIEPEFPDFIQLACVACGEEVDIEFEHLDSGDNETMFPHDMDTFCKYTCNECSPTKRHTIVHEDKKWGPIFATALFNLERLHGRQYFSEKVLFEFIRSNKPFLIAPSRRVECLAHRLVQESCDKNADCFCYFRGTEENNWYICLKDKDHEPAPFIGDAMVIEKILDSRTKDGETKYCVKWVGFSDRYTVWVNKIDQSNSDKLFKDFELEGPKTVPSKRAYKRKKKEGATEEDVNDDIDVTGEVYSDGESSHTTTSHATSNPTHTANSSSHSSHSSHPGHSSHSTNANHTPQPKRVKTNHQVPSPTTVVTTPVQQISRNSTPVPSPPTPQTPIPIITSATTTAESLSPVGPPVIVSSSVSTTLNTSNDDDIVVLPSEGRLDFQNGSSSGTNSPQQPQHVNNQLITISPNKPLIIEAASPLIAATVNVFLFWENSSDGVACGFLKASLRDNLQSLRTQIEEYEVLDCAYNFVHKFGAPVPPKMEPMVSIREVANAIPDDDGFRDGFKVVVRRKV